MIIYVKKGKMADKRTAESSKDYTNEHCEPRLGFCDKLLRLKNPFNFAVELESITKYSYKNAG